MFVEEVLASFSNELEENGPMELNTAMSRMLDKIEAEAVDAEDMKRIESCIEKYLSLQNSYSLLTPELKKRIGERLSYSYLPGYSSSSSSSNNAQNRCLNTTSRHAKTSTSVSPKSRKPSEEVLSDADTCSTPSPTPVVGTGTDAAMPANSKSYFMCSIHRHTSALSTTFRMYLDGTREFDSYGELSGHFTPPSASSHSTNLLLATKKLKSGTGAHTFVYNTADSKLWKEKEKRAAVGKITRTASGVYIGSPIAVLRSHSGARNTMTTSSPAANLTAEGTSLSPSAMPLPAHPHSTFQFPSVSSSSSSSSSTNTSNMDTSASVDSVMGSRTNSPPPPPAVPTVAAAAAAAATAATAGAAGGGANRKELELIGQMMRQRGPIAVGVNSRGMDKLIHITAVMTEGGRGGGKEEEEEEEEEQKDEVGESCTDRGAATSRNNNSDNNDNNSSSQNIEQATNSGALAMVDTDNNSCGIGGLVEEEEDAVYRYMAAEVERVLHSLTSKGGILSSPSSTFALGAAGAMAGHARSASSGTMASLNTSMLSSSSKNTNSSSSTTMITTDSGSSSRNSSAACVFMEESLQFTVLRSRLPHIGHSSSVGGGNVHAVSFGKNTRVTHASRKNLALHKSSEWVQRSLSGTHNKPPLLQIGKMGDDTFAVDFYDMSPFQAFCIAIAALDQ